MKGFYITVNVVHRYGIAGFRVNNIADAADVTGNNRETGAGDFEKNIRETVGLRSIKESVILGKIEAFDAVVNSLVSDNRGDISEKVARVGTLDAAISINKVLSGGFAFGGVELFGDLLEKVRTFLGADAARPEDVERLCTGCLIRLSRSLSLL